MSPGSGQQRRQLMLRSGARRGGIAKEARIMRGSRAMMRAWMPGFADATATPPHPPTRLLAICLEEATN